MAIELKQYDGVWQVVITERWNFKERKDAVKIVEQLSEMKEKHTKK